MSSGHDVSEYELGALGQPSKFHHNNCAKIDQKSRKIMIFLIKKNSWCGVLTPRRIGWFPCLQHCLLSTTAHIAQYLLRKQEKLFCIDILESNFVCGDLGTNESSEWSNGFNKVKNEVSSSFGYGNPWTYLVVLHKWQKSHNDPWDHFYRWDKPVMPCTSVRALHVQMCSEFTALGHVQWKKIEIFFLVLFGPSFTP
jgi:hypothetical protein